jgi:hypothetical protein
VTEERDRSWKLNLRQRARILRGRSVPQAPTDADRTAIAAAVSARMGPTGQAEGIPFDVLMTLEALRQLADQGNLAAKMIYDSERIRLGIDRPTFHDVPRLRST